MSHLISKTRILNKVYNVAIQTSKFNKFTSNVITEPVKIKLKVLSSVSQLRYHSNLSDNSDIQTVYEGKLSKNVKIVKLFSLSSSAVTILVQPYLIQKALEIGNTFAVVGVSILGGFFAFGTPLILHFFTSKYVKDIKYDIKRNIYIATLYTLFARERQIEFSPDDVTKPGMSQLLTTCYVHDTPMFFDAANFADVNHYSTIMGYDKPLDFRFEKSESINTAKPEENKKNT